MGEEEKRAASSGPQADAKPAKAKELLSDEEYAGNLGDAFGDIKKFAGH